MTAKLLCKHCKDIITARTAHNITYCNCGKIGIDDMGMGMYRVKGTEDDYSLVDNEGNVIVPKDVSEVKCVTVTQTPTEGVELSESEVYKELLQSLGHQIEALECLSQAGKFSPMTNQDFLAHLIWLQAVLIRLPKRSL